MSIPEQSGDSFDFCVLFRVYFTGKGAYSDGSEYFTVFLKEIHKSGLNV